MQQVWIPRIGRPDVLEVREVAAPTPAPGEVRVAVAAAGVNFADLMARQGLYPDAPPLPAVVGYEVAGTIDAVGAGVSPGRVGERVVAMTRFGGYSAAVCLPSDRAVALPDGVDLRVAAGVPVVFLTAWMLCEVMGRVRAGDRVLVHSAGGGVGLAALDLLRWRGATAFGTASAAKHPALLARGYARLIDYTTTDFATALADEEGFDLILDPVGGASWEKGLGLLRAGGRLAVFGMSSNAVGTRRNPVAVAKNLWAVPWRQMSPLGLIDHNRGVLGVNMGHLWHEGPRVTGWLTELLALWADGVLRPTLDAAFPFSRAHEAHQRLHDRGNLGKVVLVPDDRWDETR